MEEMLNHHSQIATNLLTNSVILRIARAPELPITLMNSVSSSLGHPCVFTSGTTDMPPNASCLPCLSTRRMEHVQIVF